MCTKHSSIKSMGKTIPELGLVVSIGGDSKTLLTHKLLNRKSAIILCMYHSVHKIYKIQENILKTTLI